MFQQANHNTDTEQHQIGTVTTLTLSQKISKVAKKAGTKVIYSVLLMWYAFNRRETPVWAKRIIIGVLGYFLAPIDAIPDLTPIVGYTDDLGLLGLGLVAVAAYINDDVKQAARKRLGKWFKSYDDNELAEVDKQF